MGRFVQRSLMKSLVRKEVMFAGWLRGVLSLTPPFGTGSNLSCWSSLLGNECCCVLLEVAAGCQGSPCSVLSTPSSVPAARTSLSSPGTAGTCPGLALALTCVLGDTFKPFSETKTIQLSGKALLVSLCQGWLNLVALSAAAAGQVLAGIINQ